MAAARLLASNKLAAVAGLVWLLALVAAAFPYLVAGGDPNAQELSERLVPPIGDGGTAAHPLGTDNLGRDVYTRLVHGARTSVAVGFGGVAIGLVLGATAGLIGGYFRRAGAVVAGLIDVQMAFPGLLLALFLAVMLGSSGVATIALVIGFTGWGGYARIVRGLVLTLREREFVAAARASGLGGIRITVRHLLPNVAPTLGVLAVIDLSRTILAEASLSFLGFGIEPPTVSWGLMLAEGQSFIYVSWWLVTLPGIAIAILVLSANVLANAFQARSDPLLRTAGHA